MYLCQYVCQYLFCMYVSMYVSIYFVCMYITMDANTAQPRATAPSTYAIPPGARESDVYMHGHMGSVRTKQRTSGEKALT